MKIIFGDASILWRKNIKTFTKVDKIFSESNCLIINVENAKFTRDWPNIYSWVQSPFRSLWHIEKTFSFLQNMSESDDTSENISETLSFENESISTTYEGVHGHIAQVNSNDVVAQILAQLDRQTFVSDLKSDEIAELKVVKSLLQSESEKKDELIQQQATKNTDLIRAINQKDMELLQLRQRISELQEWFPHNPSFPCRLCGNIHP